MGAAQTRQLVATLLTGLISVLPSRIDRDPRRVDPSMSLRWVGICVDTIEAGVVRLTDPSTLMELLPEEAAFYRGRGQLEVLRLRTSIYLRLAELGSDDRALPFLQSDLRGHEPSLMAAAARAAGALGPRAAPVVPEMSRILSADFHDAPADFPSSGHVPSSTSAQLEVVRALERIGRIGGAESEIRRIAAEDAPEADALRKTLIDECRRALGRVVPPVEAAGLPATQATGRWIPRQERDAPHLNREWVEDQDGHGFTLDSLRGMPMLITFAYSRCDNPNKCVTTMSRIATLERRLRSEGLLDRIHIAFVTFDPLFDTPTRLRQFASSEGIELGGSVLGLRMVDATATEQWASSLSASVSYGFGHVAAHGVDLMLLDRSGRLAAAFRRTGWDDAAVIDDVHHLLAEWPNPNDEAVTQSKRLLAHFGQPR